MNLFLITLPTVLLLQSTSILFVRSNDFNILPSFDEYKLIFKQIKSCDHSQDNKIQHNFYLSHNPKFNSTEIKGTTISTIPFDDDMFLEARFSRRGDDGSWKDNTFIHKSPKACSSLRLLMGPQWTNIMNGFGVKNATCPIPAGIFTASGLDTSMFSNTNIPKSFIYGTYKLLYYYTRNNEVYGCIIYVIEFKRL